MSTPGATKEQKLQRIGAIALATDTVAEPVRRDVIAHRLPSHDWPERVLRVTAIDIATGELVVFDRDSDVELVDAVAASCAVPGAWPPVTIGDRRFMDGGVGSTVNMAVAGDCDVGRRAGALRRVHPVAVRRRRGRRGRGLPRCDAGDLRRRRRRWPRSGRNPLDPACRIPSAQRRSRTGPSRGAPRWREFLGV